MRPTHTRTHGFTIIELVVVMSIALAVAGLAWSSLARQRPRAQLSTTAAEIQSLIHGARQSALSSGTDVVVMVFPQQSTTSGTGRLVVYQDGNFDFFTANAPSGTDFVRYNPATPVSVGLGRVVEVFDLPAGVVFGASPGAPSALPAPLAGIDVSADCTFCGVLSDRRGAIRFDSRGRASFHGTTGAPAAAAGGAINLRLSDPSFPGQKTLVVTPVTGSLRMIERR